MPTLDEVFALVKASGRTDIGMNIETKISPVVNDTEPYRSFTRKLVDAIQRAGFTSRATIQSFDWRTIRYARQLDRRIGTVGLVWQYGPAECATLADECSLQAAYGNPSVKSPWTGGLDWWKYQDLGKLTRAAGPARCPPTGRCTTRSRALSPRPTGTCGRTRHTSTDRTSGPCRRGTT
ncbi:hypothetical protein NKG94_23000 [Micromonospora sp. M12]